MAFSTINKGSLYQSNVLYTGNSSYGHSITGVGFQPDLVWIKKRNASADHEAYDAVRGTDNCIEPNTADAARTGVNLLHSFDADGFTVDDHGGINSANTFVAWNWKAGTTSVPSGGSITPSAVSINTTAGFGIYKYAGVAGSSATLAHGLGVAPAFIMVKDIEAGSRDWCVYSKPAGATKYLNLNTNGPLSDNDNRWYDTEPTDTLITVGDYETNESGSHTFIMYAFTNNSGFSKCGRYYGNGNADGTFVYTGFKPSWLLIKIDGSDSWRLWDNARCTFNVNDITLRTNTDDGDYGPDVANNLDFLSNGFKLRTGGNGYNGSSNTVTYMAFGQPIISNSGVCATAK